MVPSLKAFNVKTNEPIATFPTDDSKEYYKKMIKEAKLELLCPTFLSSETITCEQDRNIAFKLCGKTVKDQKEKLKNNMEAINTYCNFLWTDITLKEEDYIGYIQVEKLGTINLKSLIAESENKYYYKLLNNGTEICDQEENTILDSLYRVNVDFLNKINVNVKSTKSNDFQLLLNAEYFFPLAIIPIKYKDKDKDKLLIFVREIPPIYLDAGEDTKHFRYQLIDSNLSSSYKKCLFTNEELEKQLNSGIEKLWKKFEENYRQQQEENYRQQQNEKPQKENYLKCVAPDRMSNYRTQYNIFANKYLQKIWIL